MDQKVTATSSKLAIIHFLRGGLFAPTVISFVTVFPISVILATMFHWQTQELKLFLSVFGIAPFLLGTWLGSIYSAQHMEKVYIVSDPSAIVKKSTAFLLIFFLVSWLSNFRNHDIVFQTVYFIEKCLSIAIFYSVGKKYIRNSASQISL